MSTLELVRRLASELSLTDMSYTDEELQQLASTDSGLGEIDPEEARRLIRIRPIIIEAELLTAYL